MADWTLLDEDLMWSRDEGNGFELSRPPFAQRTPLSKARARPRDLMIEKQF
jgi:hypothetical protein